MMVVFVAVDSLGKDHLWVRPLNSPAPLLLSGTDNAYYPFWSYDSKMVAYFADGKLKKIDAKGGPAFTICDASSGRGGTWNKEGVIVFAPGANGPLYQVSSAGGTPKQITTLDSTEFEVNHRWPYFLPDGNHFFYTVQTSKPSLEEDADHIRFASLSDTKTKIVVHASSNIVYNKGWVLYYKQNSLLAQRFDEGSAEVTGEPIPILENLLYSRVRSRGTFSLSRNNRLALLGTSKSDNEMVIYAANGTVQQTIQSKVPTTWASFSTDGKYVATDALDESSKNTDLWIHDLQRNSDTRLTFDKGTEIVPMWSPDDSKVYFSSNATGVFNIYVKNSNGTGDEQLVYGSKLSSYVTDVSHDGKKLLLSINTQGPQKWDIGIFDLTEKKYTPLLTSEFNEWLGTFSPDGKWFVYQSDETGKYEVYIRPTDGSPSKWQLSTNGGSSPRWLNSGKEVIFSINDHQLFVVPVAISGNEITVGQSRLLFKIDAGFQTSLYDISRDGKQILITRTLNTQSLKSASLIFNWKNLVENK
jgi:Tol biopolymer transport system component